MHVTHGLGNMGIHLPGARRQDGHTGLHLVLLGNASPACYAFAKTTIYGHTNCLHRATLLVTDYSKGLTCMKIHQAPLPTSGESGQPSAGLPEGSLADRKGMLPTSSLPTTLLLPQPGFPGVGELQGGPRTQKRRDKRGASHCDRKLGGTSVGLTRAEMKGAPLMVTSTCHFLGSLFP